MTKRDPCLETMARRGGGRFGGVTTAGAEEIGWDAHESKKATSGISTFPEKIENQLPLQEYIRRKKGDLIGEFNRPSGVHKGGVDLSQVTQKKNAGGNLLGRGVHCIKDRIARWTESRRASSRVEEGVCK